MAYEQEIAAFVLSIGGEAYFFDLVSGKRHILF